MIIRLIALLGLLAALPLMAVVAVAVLFSVGRPLIFVQARAGLHRRPFPLLKFRSMSDARDAAGRLLPDDDRVSPFGRWLRRSRLDELPGLLNVARGDLNLVGPRPLLPATIEAMGRMGERRCDIAPGLTGWAQINGNTLLTDEQKLALDLWYIERRNWRLDLHILWRTLWVVLGGEKLRPGRIADAMAAPQFAPLSERLDERAF